MFCTTLLPVEETQTMLGTIQVLVALLASCVEGAQHFQGGSTQKANGDSNDQIERFLMENDRNWDRSRHCDWLMVMPNPHLAVKGELMS